MNAWYNKTPISEFDRYNIRQLVDGRHVGEINGIHLYKVSDEAYVRLFEANRRVLYRGNFTSPASDNTYDGGFNIVTESGLAGLYVTKDGVLQSVYNNENWRGFVELTAGAVKGLVKRAGVVVTTPVEKSMLVRCYMKNYGLELIARTVDDCGLFTREYGSAWTREFVWHFGIMYHIFIGKPTREYKFRTFNKWEDAWEYTKQVTQ